MNEQEKTQISRLFDAMELINKLPIQIVSNMLTVKEVLDILDDSNHLDDAKTLIRETLS